MDFSAAVREQLAGRIVRLGLLVEFLFASVTVRLWNGFGPLRTNDGRIWEGAANLGGVEGLQQAQGGAAPAQTFTLSGVDPTFASLARAEAGEYYNRPVITLLQFFDEAWQPLDLPVAITARLMDSISSKMEPGEDGAVYTVTLTAETPFATRRRPAYGYMTDRDQQRRYPGDRGLERVAGIDQKVIKWPDY